MPSPRPEGFDYFSNPRSGINTFQAVVARLVLRTVAVGASIAGFTVGLIHLYYDSGSAGDWIFLAFCFGIAAVSRRESRRNQPRALLPLISMLVVIVARMMSADLFVAVALLVPLMAVGLMGSFSLSDSELSAFAWVFLGLTVIGAASYVVRFGAVTGVWRGLVAATVGAGLGFLLVVLIRRENRRFVTRYEALYDGVSIGLVRFSADGYLIAANRRMTGMLGYQLGRQNEGRDVRSIIFDRSELAHAAELVRSGQPGEIQLRHRDGHPIWARVTFTSLLDDDGALLGYEGFVEDVTEKRHAREVALEAEARFATVFESAPIGMALVDVSGVIIKANQAFDVITGLEGSPPPGTPWSRVLDGQLGDANRLFDSHPGSEDSEIDVVTSSGSRMSLRVHVARQSASELGAEFAIVQLLDVTPHVELETILREQVRAKNDFIATVSHELRTPLTAVVGFLAELPVSLGAVADEPAEMLEIVTSEATSLSRIVEDLLVAGRRDLAQLPVRSEAVEIDEVVDRVVRASARIVADCGAVVSASEVAPVCALADGGRVEQILWNLTVNAVRHGGRAVALAAAQEGEMVRVIVADDGPGISGEIMEAVFEPFQSFPHDHGLTTSMGLGLYVVQQLAQRMGGSIAATSRPGCTEFVLELPAAAVAARPLGVSSA